EEQEEYRAGNKFFTYGGIGHFLRNCARNKMAKSSSGKPPGIQSSSVWLDLREIDQKQEEALKETTQGLSVGFLGMEEQYEEDNDQTESTEEESAWDLISFVFMEDDSVPDLQSVSDTEESE
ncbi:hypothetical protein C0993_006568, partial [Termitomyces sp. T159_Od127]